MSRKVDDQIAEHLRDRRFFVALSEAMRALRDEGETYEALARLARVETTLGFYTRARRSWSRALLFEQAPSAYVGLGTALFQEGKVEAARTAYECALDTDPGHISALISLGTLHLYNREFAAARRFATRAINLDPGNLEALLCRARAELGLGNIHLAEADLAALARKKYRGSEVQLLQIDLLSETGDFETALFLAAELCEAFPASRESLVAFRRAFTRFTKTAEPERLEDFFDSLEHAHPLGEPRDRPSVRYEAAGGIDVIIPVHNAPDHVKACIGSVLDKSGDRLGKIIIVDDNSDPATAEVLEEIARTEERVVLIHNGERCGFTRALMKGLERSDASHFVALNSDTLVTPGWLDALATCIRSDPDIAMAGPLSNSAAWQNYTHVFEEGWDFHATDIPDRGVRRDLTLAATRLTSKPLIEVPMLHGFCVMVERAKFDAVGGLDREAFPEGYGEFQDLSIRMRSEGQKLYVCADCIVFHSRGASLSSGRRAALSLAARETLYERYSALNYLCLEMMCCDNPELDAVRSTYARVIQSWFLATH
jgi:GT2 family glycosyltransferase/Tfp pilus assembly protein PilF